MLPVPVKATQNETQGLVDSDEDAEVVEVELTSTNNIVPIDPNRTSDVSHSRVSQRDVDKRIQSYLRESDENCRESATLVAIVIIGLVVTGSVIGFLQIGHHDPSSIHKGSHASTTHFDGEELPNNLPEWLQNKGNEIDSEIINDELPQNETLGIQPLYRNYLLQTLYEYSFESAIRIDKNDAIFQHVSMTYGGPWTVPPQRRRLNDDIDSDTEKIVFDEESEIEMISMENGRNDHSFRFGDLSNGYNDNIDEWHCYLFEFANADKFGIANKDYRFLISAKFDNYDMENGFDFVRVYINSQYVGNGNDNEENDILYIVDFDYLSAWTENDIPSLELCFNVLTDSTISKKGFDVVTKIEFENPQIITWQQSECHIEAPNWRNPSRFDGSCGIGVQTMTMSKCKDKNSNFEIIEPQNQKTKTDVLNIENGQNALLDESNLFFGFCKIGSFDKRYCKKKDCGNADLNMANNEIMKNPKLKYHFNGIGRIDPTYFDPFKVQRSTNTEFDIDEMIKSLREMSESLSNEYGDLHILRDAVTPHSKMSDSTIRLGLKLVRSLILGDTFHVVTTGSSNTAGHDNLFMSSYPMQLQSIMRPLWRRIGYKGAAFVVSNRAIGGAIGSDQLSWCVAQICGGNAEKIDVVFWESTMNDAGSDNSRRHTLENHVRNVLSMEGGTYNGNIPNRPLWHSVIAGSNGNALNMPIYSGYKDLIEQYADFGAGIIEFNPSRTMNEAKKKSENEWNDERFYVTWHPGPRGHRIYAEQISFFYLNAALSVLEDIKEPIIDLSKKLNMSKISRPVLEMLELLQDAPYESGLPPAESAKKCKPICTNAQTSHCILGFHPADSTYDISKFVINANNWTYERIAGNPQPINAMNGGQAAIDTKYGYKGNVNSGPLILSVQIDGNNYLLIEKPYADWGGLNDVIKKMATWFSAQILDVFLPSKSQISKERKNKQIGRKLECITNGKDIWNKDIMDFGCLLKFEFAAKYKLAFTVNTPDDSKHDIPICVIAAF